MTQEAAATTCLWKKPGWVRGRENVSETKIIVLHIYFIYLFGGREGEKMLE